MRAEPRERTLGAPWSARQVQAGWDCPSPSCPRRGGSEGRRAPARLSQPRAPNPPHPRSGPSCRRPHPGSSRPIGLRGGTAASTSPSPAGCRRSRRLTQAGANSGAPRAPPSPWCRSRSSPSARSRVANAVGTLVGASTFGRFFVLSLSLQEVPRCSQLETDFPCLPLIGGADGLRRSGTAADAGLRVRHRRSRLYREIPVIAVREDWGSTRRVRSRPYRPGLSLPGGLGGLGGPRQGGASLVQSAAGPSPGPVDQRGRVRLPG
jgi:hypothetical protein